jgi:hypothetical protein
MLKHVGETIFAAMAVALSPAVISAIQFSTEAKTQEQSYWLTHGGRRVESCPNKANGESFRAANGGGEWLYITASIACKETNDSYSYVIDYMSVQVNPGARARIDRPVLNFDWVGLALYQPQNNGQAVYWLYDEALPLHGSLEKTSREKIYFGKLSFPKIPKGDVEKASNFTFYLTSEGVPYAFGFK